jgi:hypothetical protein
LALLAGGETFPLVAYPGPVQMLLHVRQVNIQERLHT